VITTFTINPKAVFGRGSPGSNSVMTKKAIKRNYRLLTSMIESNPKTTPSHPWTPICSLARTPQVTPTIIAMIGKKAESLATPSESGWLTVQSQSAEQKEKQTQARYIPSLPSPRSHLIAAQVPMASNVI
jgi:hypothetical protein